MIWKFFGGFIGTLAAKLLAFLGIYRAGEKAQQSADLKAANQEDRNARKIEGAVDRMDDSQLDAALDRRMRGIDTR